MPLNPNAEPFVPRNILGYSANFTSGSGSNKQLNKINAKIRNVQNKIKQYNKNMHELSSKRNLGGIFKEQFNTARIEKHKLIKRVTRLEKNKEVYKNLSTKLRTATNKNEKMRLGKQRNEVMRRIMNISRPAPPSRGNSAMSMAPPPLPPKTRSALLLQEASKPQLVNTVNKMTGIPKPTLNRLNKSQLANVVYKETRVGPFGREYTYIPSKNIIARTRHGIRNLGRHIKNTPNRASASMYGGLGSFFARKAGNYTQRAKLSNARLQEKANKRNVKNTGKWWTFGKR